MKKRNLTAEQQAARDERRARFSGLVKRVAAMSDEERAAMMASGRPIVTVEGRPLSMRNHLLVALQVPAASVVGGFRQWIKAGRCVMKGQHGATITIPLGSRVAADGSAEGVHFGSATVFDVSQTVELGTEAFVSDIERGESTIELAADES